MNSKHFITYKSSAGSGKTYTLVKSYLGLIFKSPSDFTFTEILAITFTNKAANEMKERVFIVLEKLAANSLKDDDRLLIDYIDHTGLNKSEIQSKANKLLSVFLHRYSEISIMTIDSFAHRLIRSFSRELNLEADFEIELDQTTMLSESVDNLILKVGNDPLISKALLEFSNGLSLQDKKWTPDQAIINLVSVASRESTDLKSPEVSLDQIIEKQKQLSAAYLKNKKRLTEIAKKVVSISEKIGIDNIASKSSGWIGFFSKIVTDSSKVESQSKNLQKALFEDKWLSKTATDEAQSHLDLFKTEITEAYHEIINTHTRINEQKTLINNLIALGLMGEINKLLDVYKAENNIALLSEFNQSISEIITSEPTPFIFEKIGVKYSHYFIDEFQDTSVLQWQNFIPLVDEGLANGKDSLLVGDAKQAIYRWRNGEAKQFIDLPTIYKKRKSPHYDLYEANLTNQHIGKHLDTNYRSTATIIDFNNELFTKLTQFLTEENQKVYADAVQLKDSNKIGYTEINFNTDKTDKSFLENRLLEAVEQAIDDGFSYGDIAILVRAHAPAKVYGEILLQNNIPFVSAQSLSVLDNANIKSVIALLNCSTNIHSDTDILTILQELLPTEVSESSKLLDLKNKQVDSFKKLESILLQSHSIDFNEINGKSLYDKAIYLSKKTARNSIDRYMESFLQLLHNFIVKKGEDMAQFLDWIVAKQPKLKLNNDGQSIQLMTVHKSKGLEFPVVIIPNCNWLVANPKDKLWTDISDENDDVWSVPVIAGKSTFSKLDREVQYNLYKENQLLDVYNLLYVATTRAVNRLYLFSDIAKSGQLTEYIINSGILENSPDLFRAWGEREHVSTSSNYEPSKAFDYISNGNETELKISTKASELWNIGDVEQEKIHGDIIHHILDNSTSFEHCNIKINQLTLQGKIDNLEASKFTEECKLLFETPSIRDLLILPAISERDLLLPEGDIYRPDRVIESKNQTILIDFKGGFPQEKHKKQLANYENILEEMGYSNVKKYLLYTRNQLLVSA